MKRRSWCDNLNISLHIDKAMAKELKAKMKKKFQTSRNSHLVILPKAPEAKTECKGQIRDAAEGTFSIDSGDALLDCTLQLRQQ